MIPSRLVALVACAFLAAAVARAEPQAPATPGDAVERAFGQLPDGAATATDPDCWRASAEPDAPLAPGCLGRGRSLGEALLETSEILPDGPASARGPVESSFRSLSRTPEDRGAVGGDLMTPLGHLPDAGAARFGRMLALPPLEIARPAPLALQTTALESGDRVEDVGPEEAPVVAGADASHLADGPDADAEVAAIKADAEPAARAEELQTAAGAEAPSGPDATAPPAADVAALDRAAPTAPAAEAPAPVVAVEEPDRPDVAAVPKPSRRKASAARRAGRAKPERRAPPRQASAPPRQPAAQSAPGGVDVWRSLRVPAVRRAPLPAPRARRAGSAPTVRQPTLTEFTNRLARPAPPRPAASPRRSARP